MRRLAMAALALFLSLAAWWFVAGRKERLPREEPIALGEVLGGAAAEGYLRADKPRRFLFPQDHGPHPGFRNEWWYFTGNLRGANGRRFGYQLTFFSAALSPKMEPRASAWGTNEVIMAHFAVTDIDGKRFRFAERFSRGALGLAGAGGRPLTVRLEDWRMEETNPRPWRVRLSAADREMAIDLELAAIKPEVLNGEGGLSRKSATPGNASYYYSIPRLATLGYLRVGKERYAVSGISWLDREWSTSALDKDQQGWDWFALHLDDGRDLMYYQLRRKDGSSDPFSGGALVGRDGSAKHLERNEVRLEKVGEWKSPKTGAVYPAGWRLRIPAEGVDIEVTPRLEDQELATGFRYWEGAVSVKGTVTGSGYLEMTGYSAPPAGKYMGAEFQRKTKAVARRTTEDSRRTRRKAFRLNPRGLSVFSFRRLFAHRALHVNLRSPLCEGGTGGDLVTTDMLVGQVEKSSALCGRRCD